MTNPLTLYVMRHGQSNYNILGLCNDDPDIDVHLTDEGIKQAEAAANVLTQVPFTRIYVSQLPRTRQSAKIVNRHHNAPIITTPYLNDIRSGFEGRPVSEYFALTGDDRYNIVPPGGESVQLFQQRVSKFLDEVKSIDDSTILVVTHEETMRVFYAYFNNLEPEEMMQLNFRNCEVISFTM